MSRPVGRACAIIEKSGEEKAKFIDLGPVWRSKSGNLIFNLDVEPVVWKDPYTERKILINLDENKPTEGDGGKDLPF